MTAVSMLGESVDLLTLDTSSPRPWTRGARWITRPGVRTIRFGARGSGKSLAELILAVEVCTAGGNVIYLDWENGARRQAERLAAILADRPSSVRAAVGERFDYRPNPRLSKLDAPDEWTEQFTGCDLAVIDSTARALAQLGLDENGAADFARFMSAYIDPIANRGAAIDLLDNTGWAESDRTRGSSAKLDMCELAYRVTSTEIGPEKAGTITLDRVRSRDGDEARQLVAQVGDGTYSQLHEPGRTEREATLQAALIEHVQEHPGQTTDSIAKAVKSRASRVRDGMASLEASGTALIRPSQAIGRNGRTYTSKGWYLASQSQIDTVPDDRTASTNGHQPDPCRPAGPTPIGGTASDDPAMIERAEALADRHRGGVIA